ncbi:MAG: hypothetical protein DRR19_29115 [Candidatus Parabeggiatoa sp. nov. 1]|nr:MAG: hypothetical protein DRR19_29115 [Gammaproteobacteria bacterium]HEC85417.1 caspase family protein [Thioploca sp.]
MRFAAADAHAIHKLLTAQQRKRYKTVKSRLLADGATPPTAANIKDALKLFEQATAQDTVVLFLSGHGDNADRDYYFLPHDAKEQGTSWQPDTVIKWRELQHAIENAKGQRQSVKSVNPLYLIVVMRAVRLTRA